MSVQSEWRLSRDALISRLVGLRDAQGADLAIGIINDWQDDDIVVRAPKLDIKRIRCLVIGDITVDVTDI